jgi:HD-like signal output (HDOD) protein
MRFAMSLEQMFLDELLDAINNDHLTLPTLPEVALKIRDAANAPEVNSIRLANVITQDAALAARIIKVANSPIFRGAIVVDNLQLAITRMGISFVRNLATGLAMEQMFQATHDSIDKRLRQSWAHSLEVASISHVLARSFTDLKPDQATLAGLIHEIGILPILTFAEENPKILEKENVLDKIILRLNGKIGQTIMKAWEFPKELIDVPVGCIDFSRDGGNKADYVDVVTVAKIQCYTTENTPYPHLNTKKIPAFLKLGLDEAPDVHLVEGLSESFNEAKQALM